MKYTAYEAQVWARRQRLGDVGAKCILMILSDYADEHGTCYPGVDRIAEESEQSRSTVLRKLKALAEVGLISIERRANERGHRTSNRYVLEIALTVTREQYEAAVERVKRRADKPEEVLGVNVTPGSPEPPRCHAEREAYVSPDDTGTTSRTTSSPYNPPAPERPQSPAQGVLALVAPPEAGSPASGPGANGFDAFWASYPRRVGKAAALRAYTKAVRQATPQQILDGLDAAKGEWQGRGTPTEYIPHPATWLNAGRWEDERPATAVVSMWDTAPSPSDAYHGVAQ